MIINSKWNYYCDITCTSTSTNVFCSALLNRIRFPTVGTNSVISFSVSTGNKSIVMFCSKTLKRITNYAKKTRGINTTTLHKLSGRLSKAGTKLDRKK